MNSSIIASDFLADYASKISTYILRLEKLKRQTEHKIKLGQYRELLMLVNEINVKQERQELFESFDQAFLKLFPSFLNDFNSYLKTEDQIWPKEKELLNTSLRIYALMRLGIKENQAVACILESSVSTVYTYKFRIKTKALLPGDIFESKIMEIPCFDGIQQQTED